MKVLVVSSPGAGHLFPLVPLAWALRSAGHDVLVAASGAAVELGPAAGMTVVDVAPGTDEEAIFREAATRRDAPGPGQDGREFAVDLFSTLSATTLDGLRALVDRWRPDLVVHGQLQIAGAVVAAEAGVPAVEHLIGTSTEVGSFTRPGWERLSDVGFADPVGVVSVVPPSIAAPPERGWAMRLVPYSGGAILPAELAGVSERPRVLVTLGTVVPRLGGVDAVRGIVGAIAGQLGGDVEVLVALGTDPGELGAVPDGVRAHAWLPLSAVLPTCRAVVHHGGAGTTLAALAAGVGQVVQPRMADQFANAERLRDHGTALWPSGGDGDEGAGVADAVRRVLDGELDATVAAVRAENRTLPTPAEVAASMEAHLSG